MQFFKMLMYSVFTILIPIVVRSVEQEECVSRDYGKGSTVCVCNSDHCDTLPRTEKVKQPQFITYTSNKAGARFKKDIGEFGAAESAKNQIRISYWKKYQKIIGFGGAFTDSTGINIKSLEESLQDKLLQSYFADNGIEYNMARIPIGGTDFSTHEYTYDDGVEDPKLLNFALAEEDHLFKIPFIKKALQLTNNNLQLIASAWAAPKWMKTLFHTSVMPEMYQSWANYHIKFLDSYKAEGVPFWGLTTGNEPHSAFVPTNPIKVVSWKASEMSAWIINNLGPTLRKSAHSNIKLMTLDDQRLFLPGYVKKVFQNDTARKYVDGIAVHYYVDILTSPSRLDQTHELYPDKFILGTEASFTSHIVMPSVDLGSWFRGEFYANDIIDDLQHWVTGWVDWNLALDPSGGPTYIHNLVDSPIIVNATGGEFYKQPMFYVLGHFSKFIPKDSVRIESSSNLDYQVKVVAFQKPDNGTVVVILNKKGEVVPFSLIDEKRGFTKSIELSEKSITTILYW